MRVKAGLGVARTAARSPFVRFLGGATRLAASWSEDLRIRAADMMLLLSSDRSAWCRFAVLLARQTELGGQQRSVNLSLPQCRAHTHALRDGIIEVCWPSQACRRKREKRKKGCVSTSVILRGDERQNGKRLGPATSSLARPLLLCLLRAIGSSCFKQILYITHTYELRAVLAALRHRARIEMPSVRCSGLWTRNLRGEGGRGEWWLVL